MLTLTATLTVKAGQEDEFERIMHVVVPKVREEPGNHAYSLHRSAADPRVFLCTKSTRTKRRWNRTVPT